MCGGCGWGRFMRELVPPLCSATSGCVCVRISMRFLNLWQLDWLSWIGLTVAACELFFWKLPAISMSSICSRTLDKKDTNEMQLYFIIRIYRTNMKPFAC